MRRARLAMLALALPSVVALGLTAIGLAPATRAATPTPPKTTPASGTFSFTTANGILPTWEQEDIVLIGVSPGSVTTTATGTTARVTLPIVAKTGSANAAAGGFRMTNTRTGASVRCSTPTIDTLARVVDCVLGDGTNADLLAITSIASRSTIVGSRTTTTLYRGVVLRVASQDMADKLNQTLDTSAFSTSVTVGRGDLLVTRAR